MDEATVDRPRRHSMLLEGCRAGDVALFSLEFPGDGRAGRIIREGDGTCTVLGSWKEGAILRPCPTWDAADPYVCGGVFRDARLSRESSSVAPKMVRLHFAFCATSTIKRVSALAAMISANCPTGATTGGIG